MDDEITFQACHYLQCINKQAPPHIMPPGLCSCLCTCVMCPLYNGLVTKCHKAGELNTIMIIQQHSWRLNILAYMDLYKNSQT